MRSERWIWPGTYSRPADPMPFTSPSIAPLLVTHGDPFGPSVTKGLRSGRPAEALTVRSRAGGRQSWRWRPAEFVYYGSARERRAADLPGQARGDRRAGAG